MERHPGKACQKWLLQTFIALISMGCDTSMVGIWNILRAFPFHVCMGSSTNWLAITRTVCIICENCHMIISCWPYLHATIYNFTRVDPPGASPSVSCLVPCVGFLASRQLSPTPDLTWTNEAFPASHNNMLPFRSIRMQLQTKGLSGSISSNIWLRFWVLTVLFFWKWSLLQQL